LRQSPYASGPLATRAISLLRSGRRSGVLPRQAIRQSDLSGASIGDPTVLRELASAIKETGADPSLLVVEVTETAMMNQLDAGRRFAQQVTALGCRLALDDFGTGFASLSYLKQIPAQLLEIDIEFVRDLVHNDTDERLVRGIIGIAREFDQTTVAEGIEDEATLIRLRELGVHLGQGYLFGRPKPLSNAAVIAPPVTSQPDPRPLGLDPVNIVRRAFGAFAGRDLDTMLQLSHPDIIRAIPRPRRPPRLRTRHQHRLEKPDPDPDRVQTRQPHRDRLRPSRRTIRQADKHRQRALGLAAARPTHRLRRGLPNPTPTQAAKPSHHQPDAPETFHRQPDPGPARESDTQPTSTPGQAGLTTVLVTLRIGARPIRRR